MFKQAPAKRSNVTVDDRRAVIADARKFKPTLKENREQFIRNALKARLNWPERDPAPESVKLATKEMSAYLSKIEKEARIAEAAKAEAKRAEKAGAAEQQAA